MDYREPTHLAPYPPPYHPQAQPHFPSYPPQQNPSLNPNPSFDQQPHSVPPPIGPPPATAMEPFYPVDHGGAYASQATVHGGDYNVGNDGLTLYYHDPNWATIARFENYRSNPVLFHDVPGNALPSNAAQQFVAANYNHNSGTTWKFRRQGKISLRKSLKKTKIPQSIRCDVCKILCDTEDVLKKHRLGRKHKQNLEKLKAVVAGQAAATNNSATTAQEAPETSKSINGQTKKKKASQKADDLESKKKRVLDGGAAMDSVRTCSICKVVCNSETVFQYHLAGQKHAAMVKKQAPGTTTQTAVAS